MSPNSPLTPHSLPHPHPFCLFVWFRIWHIASLQQLVAIYSIHFCLSCHVCLQTSLTTGATCCGGTSVPCPKDELQRWKHGYKIRKLNVPFLLRSTYARLRLCTVHVLCYCLVSPNFRRFMCFFDGFGNWKVIIIIREGPVAWSCCCWPAASPNHKFLAKDCEDRVVERYLRM